MSTSVSLAQRSHGVCQGSLTVLSSPSGSSSSSSSSKPVEVYCVLVGVWFQCFDNGPGLGSAAAPSNPIASYRLLGASSVTASQTLTKGGPAAGATPAASSNAGPALTDFRLVTNQGTHLLCTAPTSPCRDAWLEAIQTGLQTSFTQPSMSSSMIDTPSGPTIVESNGNSTNREDNFCRTFSQHPLLQPVKPRTAGTSPKHNRKQEHPPYCRSCGRLERHEFPLSNTGGKPLGQYGMESCVPICPRCHAAQGLVDHLQFHLDLYASHWQEQGALQEARCFIVQKLNPKLTFSDSDKDRAEEERTSTTTLIILPTESSMGSLQLTPLSHNVLSLALQNTDSCRGWANVSPTFDTLRSDLLQGEIGVLEFVEALEFAIGICDPQIAELKQQAFRMSGDMGNALQLLQRYAVPSSTGSTSKSNHNNKDKDQELEPLRCVLEFFLDLLDAGELNTIAFFWPQIVNLHLQMLPAMDTKHLLRVEIMEDFLITVATNYSIHLAIELIWSHQADLEDSFTSSPANATTGRPTAVSASARRRFAVLRFLCELESALLDHHNDYTPNWTNGSVITASFLRGPSKHQTALLKRSMQLIQNHRALPQSKASWLSRSRRWKRSAPSKNRNNEGSPDRSMEMAHEALRRTLNADYLSTHLAFTKRLCEIAEKLRFLPIEQRAQTLETELSKLNASGTMGGDLLNNVKAEGYMRVAKIPKTEGHVFRSKERTPVLLLVEVLDETMTGSTANSLVPFPSSREKAVESQGKSDHVYTNGEEEEIEAANTNKVEMDKQVSETTVGSVPASNIPLTGEHPEECTKPNKIDGSSIPGTPVKDFEADPHALRRFDGQESELIMTTPTPSKKTMEALVHSAVANRQMLIPSLAQTLDFGKDDCVEKSEGTEDSKAQTLPDSGPISRQATVLSSDRSDGIALSRVGDTRREVLNALMMKGKDGSNVLAAGTATAMQRQLQDLERRRAAELLRGGDDIDTEADSPQSHRQELLKLGVRSLSSDGLDLVGSADTRKAEEDEVIESIRLLLIQSKVALGQLSMNDAAAVLSPSKQLQTQSKRRAGRTITTNGREFPEIDAGEFDPRLNGCGAIPPAVLQALTLWKANMINNGELLELVKKDLEFNKISLGSAQSKHQRDENSAFWGRFAFGERWAEKRSRMAANSPNSKHVGWDLHGVIVKSNDDLRQEAFVMQLIELSRIAFKDAGLELWLFPYRIISTGRSTGIIEMVRNAMSFDALKKRPGYGNSGLKGHLQRMTQHAADPSEAYENARKNFVRSLAAYSLLSHVFLFKDRHNGNILLDTVGHVIHIDFGFVFGIAPGGSFSLEMSTPFKLTEEMVQVMGGLTSTLFSEFITLFCCGFLALQAHMEIFSTLASITCGSSTMKCFEGRGNAEVVEKLRERFKPNLDKEATIEHCLDLINTATQSYGTSQYDYFQYLSQGIAP